MPFADFIDDCLPVVVKNDDEQLIQQMNKQPQDATTFVGDDTDVFMSCGDEEEEKKEDSQRQSLDYIDTITDQVIRDTIKEVKINYSNKMDVPLNQSQQTQQENKWDFNSQGSPTHGFGRPASQSSGSLENPYPLYQRKSNRPAGTVRPSSYNIEDQDNKP